MKEAWQRYRSGGWLSALATVVVIAVLLFFYLRSLDPTIVVKCDGKVMSPRDLCIGKHSYNYQEEYDRIAARKEFWHSWGLKLLVIPLVALVWIMWRVLARRRTPPPDTPGATWHGAGVLSSAVGIAFGLGLMVLGAYMFLASELRWMGLLALLGALLLYGSWPHAPQLVRADDAGLLVWRGRRETQIPWASIVSTDPIKGGGLTVRHQGGQLNLLGDLNDVSTLAGRIQAGGSPATDPGALTERLRAGETLGFGTVSLESPGLAVGGHTVAWGEIATVGSAGDTLTVNKADGTSVSTPLSGVENRVALLQVIEALVKAHRQQS